MVLLKLYGSSLSPNVRRVIVVLVEKEVPFELVDVERGDRKSAEYLKLHPFGQIPCIVRETHGLPCRSMNIINVPPLLKIFLFSLGRRWI